MRNHHKGIRAQALNRVIDHQMAQPGNIVERPPAIALHYPGKAMLDLSMASRQRLEDELHCHVLAEGDR